MSFTAFFYNDYSETVSKSIRALFPGAGECLSISGIGIEDSYITANAKYATAAFIGRVTRANGSIDQCYVGESVYLYGDELGGFIGGGTIAADDAGTYGSTKTFGMPLKTVLELLCSEATALPSATLTKTERAASLPTP